MRRWAACVPRFACQRPETPHSPSAPVHIICSPMRARTRRLWSVGTGAVLLAAASALAFIALGQMGDMFVTPKDLAERGGPEVGKRMRLGGMVLPGSLKYGDGADMHFRVVDGAHHVDVTFEGIAPELFQEGSGVIATGTFDDEGNFTATNILAKHDENYHPRELEDVSMPES